MQINEGKAIGEAKIDNNLLQAVYYHNNQDKAEILNKLSEFSDINILSRDARIFSPYGTKIDPGGTFDNDMHYLAPLNNQFKRAYVFYRSIPLAGDIPLYSVLGMMLLQMDKDAELYIQLPRGKLPPHQWVTKAELQDYFPSVKVSVEVNELFGLRKGWISVQLKEGLKRDVSRLDCIYPKLALNFPEFRNQMNKDDGAAHKTNLEKDEIASQSFIYSMHWALATSAIIRSILRQFKKAGPLKGIDIGGHRGFLACELAKMGHTVTNFEPSPFGVQQITPWLSQFCEVSERLDGKNAVMEDLNLYYKEENIFDFVCLMGSLLLCKRERLDDVLQTIIRLLKPGGLIILRENIRQVAKIPHPTEFEADEMNAYLEKAGGKLIYYDHFGHEIDYSKVQQSWVVYAAIQKVE